LLESENAVWIATQTAMSLTHEAFTRHFFRQVPNAFMWWYGAGKLMAKQRPQTLKWTGLLTDLDVSRQGWEYFSSGLKDAHKAEGRTAELVTPVTAKFGATDYRNQLASIMSSPAEGLFIGVLGADVISFLQQGKGMSLSSKINTIFDFSLGVDIPRALKDSTPANTYSVISWLESGYDNPASKAFAAEVRKRTNAAIVTSVAAQANAIVYNYASAVRAAKSSEPKAVVNALETTTIEGSPYGSYRFRKEDHQSEIDMGYVKMGPSPNPPGWTAEFMSLPWREAAEPPTPGVKFDR
jgi:branched-chain amino acid transport system substrate-binding protein